MSAAVITPDRPLPDRPLPRPARESQAFWDGLREARFMIQHCTACGRPRHYPRPVCPHCWSMESDFREAPLTGRVHTWTVCHHPFNFAFKQATPYLVVLADMDVGVRVNAPLHGVAEADLRIGLPVRLSFEAATPEITLPCLIAA